MIPMKKILLTGLLLFLGSAGVQAQYRNEKGYDWDTWADCEDWNYEFGDNVDCGNEPAKPPRQPAPQPAPPPPPEPTPAEKLTKQAGESYSKKSWDDVIRLAAESIALDGSKWLPYHYRGWAYYFKGDYKKAAEDHIKTVEIGPKDDPYLSFTVSLCKSLQGLNQESLEWAGRALGIKPGFAMALTQMGFTYFDLGEDDLAVSKFKDAIASDPKRADAHLGLALVRARQGKTAQARIHLIDAKVLTSDLYSIDIWMSATRRLTAKQKKALQPLLAPKPSPKRSAP